MGSSAAVQKQRSSLSLSHLPFLFLSSSALFVRFSPGLSSAVQVPPVFNDRSPRAQSEEISDASNKHTLKREDKSEFLFSFWCFFWILTQILSVCPLLCSSHDSACRRNSRRREKRERGVGGLGAHKVSKVEERGESKRERGSAEVEGKS